MDIEKQKLNFMKIFKLKVISVILFSTFIGCNEPQPDENAQNIKRIKIGMPDQEVREIMGNPDTTGTPPLREKLYYFEYSSPSLYSGNFIIYFSTKDSVVEMIDNGL